MQVSNNSITFVICKIPPELLHNNSLFIGENDFNKLKKTYNFTAGFFICRVNHYIYKVEMNNSIKDGEIAFGKVKVEHCGCATSGNVTIEYLPSIKIPPAGSIKFNIILKKKSTTLSLTAIQEYKEEEIEKEFRGLYNDSIVNFNQIFYFSRSDGSMAVIEVITLNNFDGTSERVALFNSDTQLEFTSVNKDLKVINKSKPKKLTKEGFNFQAMGVGGMHDEINKIFRTAFVSRQHSAETLRKFGTKHVKGVLLYGPPGTGKTLIARTLANMLDAEECKIVNGPELFDKYVGETEKKIRELFVNAENDEKQNGENSGLHVIVFDEIDSICRARGTINSGTGVHDSAVNQLLTKIDGVESLNNILIIGMTNRKELIDEAILRPGRLEVHVEIQLPTFEERKEIFNIHMKSMLDNKLVDNTVNIDELARKSKNFTGAEIETLVKRAASYAMNCFSLGQNVDKKQQKVEKKPSTNEIGYRLVNMNDFDLAFDEVKPMFGSDNVSLEASIRFGMLDYGDRFKEIQDQLFSYVNQLKNSKSANMMSILLHGQESTGKTSLACHVALKSGFPYIKIISPDNLVKLLENGKAQEIMNIFENAYKSPLSIIIVDNIERLIEYIKIGPRFSNLILQTLLVYISKAPTNRNNKIMIIGTTSNADRMDDLELVRSFNYRIKVPTLSYNEVSNVLSHYLEKENEIFNKIVDLYKAKNVFTPIKTLLMSIDETQQEDNGSLSIETFSRVFNSKYLIHEDF